MANKVRVTELKGVPHALTQTNGKTFRIFARQERVISEDLVSPEFYAEQKSGGIRLTVIKGAEKTTVKKSESVEETNNKGGNK